jgi:AdoMet-dependent rRNA methyltransferase SPB1
MELEDFDPEDLATNMVLAKKMLRKRNRDAIMDSTYSKYAIDSEDENLPEWFFF